MIVGKNIVDMLIRDMYPVKLEIEQNGTDIRLLGSFLGMEMKSIISATDCAEMREEALFDILITRAYDIKNKLLLATCDDVQTPSS